MINDFIYHDKNKLSLEECKSLIDFYESSQEYHQDGSIGLGAVDFNKKKCQEMFISSKALSVQDKYFSSLHKDLVDSITQYKTKYPFLNEVRSWNIAHNFKIKKYLPKEAYFVTHCENNGYENGETERRLIAWMIYLNDVTDGGETEFPTQCKKFAPRAGDVLIWPAYWTHPHHGLPSPTQNKYIVSGWFRYNND
tara:strand:+ start:36 stop:620 length:585 start_codon:yes stop_codon:yes gene_type:complete